MPLRIQFKKKEALLLNKLALKLKPKDVEFRYIPFWFKKVDNDTYDILTADQVPPEVIKELREKIEIQAARKDTTRPWEEIRSELNEKHKIITLNRGK